MSVLAVSNKPRFLPVQAGERTRTADPLFTRQALYQLSYSGKMAEFSGLCSPFSRVRPAHAERYLRQRKLPLNLGLSRVRHIVPSERDCSPDD